MNTVYKIGNGKYFEGNFYLRNRETTNWAYPIDCPTIFEAKGKGIKSGNWQSCTSINSADYVIKNYLNGRIINYIPNLTIIEKREFWNLAKEIEKYNKWETVDIVIPIIQKANDLINKLETI